MFLAFTGLDDAERQYLALQPAAEPARPAP
jgi:hypothetical protein